MFLFYKLQNWVGDIGLNNNNKNCVWPQSLDGDLHTAHNKECKDQKKMLISYSSESS